ncbi:MAG: hypothetical protein NTZ39_06310 [Methanoregula sp.]|nr:hypothetical protein [Methanoregula sp.]
MNLVIDGDLMGASLLRAGKKGQEKTGKGSISMGDGLPVALSLHPLL